MAEKDFFCKQIKKIMFENNVTQQDLADKLGITQTVVSRWVRGARKPSLETIRKFANIFDVPLNYFIEHNEEKSNKTTEIDLKEMVSKHNQEIILLRKETKNLKDKIKLLEKKIKN